MKRFGGNMKGFKSVSSKFMIVCAVAVMSFTHVASAQISSPRTVKDWEMDGGHFFVDEPDAVNMLIQECSHLGNPPVGRSKALIKNYCALLSKCLERKLTDSKPTVVPMSPPFSPLEKQMPKIRTSPQDLRQIVEAAKMACLSALLE